MARKRNDLTGQRFGRLTVIKRDEDYVHETLDPYMEPKISRSPKYICRCDCGNTVSVMHCNLISGASTSCGCKRRERMRELALSRRRAKSCG